ncbi:hypothetical protein [Aphanothece sacrum]|uniref:Isoleucyl-tRNA synthase n=1 Tax=Aphanothece sacrum FPU1 TaxID=1920663 RepID=A0A401INB6_APHSA|nr:hypothetical protein [Aphanothece sacrum]GBF82745.1 isoleucyl-tRNA synthase [Aphanothece sacrum FPU1]GBF84464.1 isoleucyl-tRNA synthase [Aphanothece sacrum FPU3]
MTTYNQVLTEIQSLSLSEQLRLLDELKVLVSHSIEVEGDDETIPIEDIMQSQTAWEDYISGKDQGITSQDLKRKLLGENFA